MLTESKAPTILQSLGTTTAMTASFDPPVGAVSNWDAMEGLSPVLSPIEYDPQNKERVVFDPSLMIPGYPHQFQFLDRYMVAIKNADDSIDIYYFPE